MTVSEAAERFGTDAAGVWELVAEGRLVATRDGDAPWNLEESL